MTPSGVSKILLVITGVLTLAHVSVLIAYYVIGDPDQFDFVRLVDFDYEGNIPTLFSSFLLLLCSGLFYLNFLSDQAASQTRNVFWVAYAIIFLFLCLDEGTRLHEQIGDVMENHVEARGLLYFPWVLPYSVVTGIIALLSCRFIFGLPSQTRNRLFIAAAIYLVGAIGFDMLGAMEADANGTETIAYSVLYTIEELMEMLGLILLAYTLLARLSNENPQWQVQMRPGVTNC